MFPGEIYDISYSTFREGYISNNNDKESMKWVLIDKMVDKMAMLFCDG